MLTAGMRRYAMVLLTIAYLFNFIDRQILAILWPAIREEFQVGDTMLGLLTGTVFALFYVTLGVPIARHADRANRRNLIAIALVVWSGVTALSGVVQNLWQLTLARIGVGIGEAGFSPPAHSIIADLYPPERRSTAMGFFTLGIPAGIMFAFMSGGWVAENIGWREAFFIVGVPGLVLALLVRFTITEPERGASENRKDSGRQPSISEVSGFLLSRPAALHMGLAAGLSAFIGYAVINLMPSFLVRSFGMGLASIGFWLGLICGLAGGAGFFFGGYIADKLGRTGQRRALRFLALSMLVSTVANVAVFLATTATWSLAMLVLPMVVANFYLAPVFAYTQGLVPLRMRAVASALILLVINAIGLALGPLCAGFLSDRLEPAFATESLRYSLLIVSVVVPPWAAWHYYRASRTIEADLARAREGD